MSETATLTPVEGVHYIRLVDRKTKKNYALTIDEGEILLAEISTDSTGATTLIPIKRIPGTTDRVVVQDGSLTIILKGDDVNG